MYPTAGLDPAYAKAAMALSPGQTSDLVRSQFGYHIIQTEQKEGAHLRPIAEVKAEIVPVLEQQKAGAAENNFANELTAAAKQQGLEKAAASKGLKVVTTDFIGKDGIIAGLADGTAVVTQAFTMAKGAAPASASTGDGFAVFQVTDVQAAHAPDFATYKSHILDDYREQQLPQLLTDQIIKLDGRAKVLNDLKKAAAEMKIPVKTSDFVDHSAQVPDVGSLAGPAAVVFTLPKGSISSPVNLGRSAAVFSIVDTQEPSADEIAKNFNTMRDQLLGTQREEIFRVYIGNLSDKYTKAGSVRYAKKQAAPGSSPFGN
jgi:peptidyl-prolyl cis-trans isomerase D